MTVPYAIVDVFTQTPFAGNPAGVVTLPSTESPTDTTLALIAREIGCPNTAFLTVGSNGLRWFTAGGIEVRICGHGTIAAAHVMGAAEITFTTLSGELQVTASDRGFELDLPIDRAHPVEPPAGLIEALGGDPLWVGRNSNDYVVRFRTQREIERLAPSMAELAAVETRGVIVTAPGDDADTDYVLRFFGPRVGVYEDNVTGTAHCALGPMWSDEFATDTLTSVQMSPRPGSVSVACGRQGLTIIGHAVTSMVGQIEFIG